MSLLMLKRASDRIVELEEALENILLTQDAEGYFALNTIYQIAEKALKVSNKND